MLDNLLHKHHFYFIFYSLTRYYCVHGGRREETCGRRTTLWTDSLPPPTLRCVPGIQLHLLYTFVCLCLGTHIPGVHMEVRGQPLFSPSIV